MKALLALCLSLFLFGAQANLNFQCEGAGLYGLYIPNVSLGGPISLLKTVSEVNFNFGVSNYPDPNFQYLDNYSIHFTGVITPTVSGSYLFTLRGDDGVRLMIDGKRVTGDFRPHEPTDFTGSVSLDAGQSYLLSLEFYELTEAAVIELSYRLPGTSTDVIVPSTVLNACKYVPKPLNYDCSSSPAGLVGSYYSGSPFTGTPTTVQTDSFSPFKVDWGYNSPLSLPANDFGVKWTGVIEVPTTGTYRLGVVSTEALKLSVDGVVVFEGSDEPQNYMRSSPLMVLTAGKYYPIEVIIYETSEQASFDLQIQTVAEPGSIETVPLSYLKACVPPAIISPARVSISGSSIVTIPVYLSAPPTGKITVTITADSGVGTSPCVLYFDENNWNIPQDVIASSNSSEKNVYFETSTITILDSTTTITGEKSTGSSETGYGAECKSYGDPHFSTLDGKTYDFFGIGEYYVIRSLNGDLVIQNRQQPCGTASCNYGFAIKYGTSVMIIYLDANTGTPRIYGNEAFHSLSGFTTKLEGTTYTFEFPNFLKAVVYVGFWDTYSVWFMNGYFTVPASYKNKVRGLCGTYDQDLNNDFHDSNGGSVDITVHVNTWKVTTEENLFLNENNTIPSLPGGGSTHALLIDCTPDPTPKDIEKDKNINNTTPDPHVFTCDKTTEEIQAYCTSLFQTSQIATECSNEGVDTEILYQNCITDVTLMCDYNVVRSMGTVLESECRQKCTNCNVCRDNCHFAGTCINGKCQCTSGYRGETCEYTPDNVPCATSVTPSSGKAGDTVTITGEFFPSNEAAICVFGNKNVAATIISPFKATCVVPGSNSPGTYPVVIQFGTLGDNCGATFTYTSGKGNLDPHFYGFNGEHMEVKKDAESANQHYHLYCSESITVTTFFHEYPNKLLFMTKFWIRLGDAKFTLNLSPIPKMLVDHEPAVYLADLKRYRIYIPDGHLEWDDNVLRVVYKYIRMNFSNKIYLNGEAYMNIDVNMFNAPTEKSVTGIIGRTVWHKLADKDFEQFQQYKATLSQIMDFSCPLEDSF